MADIAAPHDRRAQADTAFAATGANANRQQTARGRSVAPLGLRCRAKPSAGPTAPTATRSMRVPVKLPFTSPLFSPTGLSRAACAASGRALSTRPRSDCLFFDLPPQSIGFPAAPPHFWHPPVRRVSHWLSKHTAKPGNDASNARDTAPNVSQQTQTASLPAIPQSPATTQQTPETLPPT